MPVQQLQWVSRACPLCGPGAPSRILAESNIDASRLDEFAFASRKLPEYMHPRLRECQSCAVVYGDPVLSLDSISAGYREARFDSGEEASYASRTYQALIERVARQLPDRVGALDIGTGDGAFLERLVEIGFSEVCGIEPSEAPMRAAKPHIRERIRAGLFDAADFEPGRFSLITCFQVMEHVWDPLATCQGAFRILKPGGALVAVVHNRNAFSAKVLGRKSPIYDIEHLQLFSVRSCRRLFEQAGFTRVQAKSVWNRYPLHYWIRLFPFPVGFKKNLASYSRTGVLQMPVSLPAGNLVVWGFKGGE